ncbi:MAG: restriction endonuclease [Caldilineaceae bacterium]|nr:restriction endonuclease [Caldilineaceae bacterium]
MSQRTLAFQQPNWKMLKRAPTRLGVLVTATLLWLLLYAGLGWRIWAGSAQLFTHINALLAAFLIVLGVVVFMGWKRHWPALRLGWTARRARSPWSARSQNELQTLTPSEFEAYVAQRIFARQGYAVVNTADTKDGGIDIRLTDSLGYQAIVQCKRYAGTVGVGAVRDLYGTMLHDNADYGYLAASGAISADARAWAQGKPIGLLDGKLIARLSQTNADPTYLQSRYRPLYRPFSA